MREEDIKYINELEERVQELEGKLGRCESLLKTRRNAQIEAEFDNKHYREAIKVAVRNMKSSDNLGVKFALDILNEVLEGGN